MLVNNSHHFSQGWKLLPITPEMAALID